MNPLYPIEMVRFSVLAASLGTGILSYAFGELGRLFCQRTTYRRGFSVSTHVYISITILPGWRLDRWVRVCASLSADRQSPRKG